MTEQHQPSPEGTAPAYLEPRFRKLRLNPVDASAYLGEVYGTPVAVATLAKWRCLKSDGPPFQQFGRSIFYRRLDLDVWASARLGEPMRSTSEADHA